MLPCLHLSLCELRRARAFSEWEKLLQSRCTNQSVVCAMWQPASTHSSPWYAPTYWPYVDTTHKKQTASHQQRAQPDIYFLQGLYWLGCGLGSTRLPNPLKSVRHYKLSVRQISRVSYTTSQLKTSHYTEAHNIGITIFEAKVTSIEDRFQGYSQPPMMGLEPPAPQFWAVFLNRPYRGSNR